MLPRVRFTGSPSLVKRGGYVRAALVTVGKSPWQKEIRGLAEDLFPWQAGYLGKFLVDRHKASPPVKNKDVVIRAER